ncbi:MAG: ribonuclease Z [Bacteroidales bacterium]|jgi:ribonuclease Z|nr:ribonuclease Z [Bacteroidales bacterium]
MSFRLTILGTSSALPTSDRYPTAHVLNVHERLFLIDCGEGTQMQMRRYRIRFGKINHIFISHLHGDHFFGLYPLLSSFNLMGRKSPLNIYAPAPFEEMLARHLKDFDIKLGFELITHGLSGRSMKLILDDKRVQVFSFPLKHRVKTFGYLFREKEKERKIIKECVTRHKLSISEIALLKSGADIVRESGEVIINAEMTTLPPPGVSYAFCSDTAFFPKLASYVAGVNMLYHEATFGDDHETLARQTGHSTARHAAVVAREAGAGRLLLGHFSARYKSPVQLEEEARQVFPASEAAREGETYDI